MDQLLLEPGRFSRLDLTLSYVRTKDDVEIDLLVERPGMPGLFVEIKSKNRVDATDTKALETLGKDLDAKRVLNKAQLKGSIS